MARQVRRAKKVIYVFREGESEKEYAKRIRVAFSDAADKDNARRRVQQLVPGYEKGDPVTIGQIFPHSPRIFPIFSTFTAYFNLSRLA